MFVAEPYARKKPEVRPENRVGNFFSISITRTGGNPPQALEPHQDYLTADTTTVSGVVYWLSKDPIGINGGLNQYVFCGNNPINRIDPYGLAWYDDWHYEGRNSRNSNLPSSPADAARTGGARVPDSMNRYHDNGDAYPESKYIFPDGREAVYDGKTGNLITDPNLKGTYNYVNPSTPSWNPLTWTEAYYRGLGHFFTDMLPYYMWDNERTSSECSK